MKKVLLLSIFFLFAFFTQAQVNGFSLVEPSFPTAHNLGTSFPLNVSFNWTPTTTSAIVVIDYDASLVGYDASCASSLPGCLSISNSGTQLTVNISNLLACTNTGAISFNLCFKFNCPDSCTGTTKTALFTATITDNLLTEQNSSCQSNGILNNSTTLSHSFFSFNQLTAEVTYKVCFNNPGCFKIANPEFSVALAPSIGTITSVYGNNFTYSLNGNNITPNVSAFNPYANDCFYYVVKLPCGEGLGETLTSNVTWTGTNCNVPESNIRGPVPASYVIPATPAANSNIVVTMSATSNYFSYNIYNTGNTPLNLIATNYLPQVHLKSNPSNSVMQNTTQAGLVGSINYFDCNNGSQGTFPLIGNVALDQNAPSTNTKLFQHQVTGLLPGQSVSLYMYYDLTSSCSGDAGTPPFIDSLSVTYICAGTGASDCVSCDEEGEEEVIVEYNPQPNMVCVLNQNIPGCRNTGDTLDLCYEFRNNGDNILTGGLYNVQLPAWLEAITSSVVYTGFSSDPVIVPSTNIQFTLPDLAFGTNTYKICFKAVVRNGAIGGSHTVWTVISGSNLPNPQNLCRTSFNICAFAAIGIDKKVKGDLDADFTYNGFGSPNSTVQYEITITNTGTVAVDSLVVIDRIPQPGNLTILGSPNSAPIPNDFQMEMLPAIPDVNYTAEYTSTQNICTGWPATGLPCNAGTWGTTTANGGVRFTFNPGFTLSPGASYTFMFETQIPDTADNGMVDCNTAGFIGKSTTGGYTINPVETNPVCITAYIDTCNFLCNSDFEDNQVVGEGGQGFFDPELISCWNTTEEFIEVWGDGFQNVPSYSGNQFIELNAHTVGTLFQDFTITPGSTTTITFAHRGRVGFTNDMSVAIEPAPLGSGTQVILGTFSAVTTAWTLNTVSYTFPNNGVTAYVLSFISLPVGGTSAGGNFLDAITIACPSSICGFKYHDLNGNGVWDTGEPGLDNWTINLSGTMTSTTTTDTEGRFCFTDLPAGTYTISEENQEGCDQTAPPSPGTFDVTLLAGQVVDSLAFGNLCEQNEVGSLCGFKYHDLNGNGVWDSNEPRLPNWTINLTGGATQTTTTNENGFYCFNDLPIDSYTVSEVNQANWQQTQPASPGTYFVNTIAGQTIDTLLFGNHFESSDFCSETDSRITQSAMGECCFIVEISNNYLPNYFSGISITSDNLTISNVSNGNSWSTITYQTPNQVIFTKTPFFAGIPLDTGGYQTLGNLCFAGTGLNNITISFIGDAPDYDTICTKILQNEGCSVPVDTSCVAVYDLRAECETGNARMKFKLTNNSNFTMRGVTLYSQNPDVVPSPKFVPIADLLPGQTSTIDLDVLLQVSNNAGSACFFIAACDQNTQPGEQGQYPQYCCMDSILYCVEIPHCDPCDAISISASENDPDDCCYNLDLHNNYNNSGIGYLEFIGLGGTQFAILSGWSIIPPASSSHIKIKAPGGGISSGNYADFASFCLTGTSTAPHMVMVKIFDVSGLLLCTQILEFDCELVEPECANIVNDSLYCDGSDMKFTFSVKNNAPFPLYQIDFRTPDMGILLDTTYMELNPPIAIGSTGGPYTITILSADENLDKFCIYLSGHNGIYNPELGLAATQCCTDSLGGICLPLINCSTECDTAVCCQFENMIIPNGITPNEDGKNDAFVIQNASCCERIAIEVYNRWGNLLYTNDDYKNDWKGVNQSGQQLVQGTYFMIIALPTGHKKALYIDIRY